VPATGAMSAVSTSPSLPDLVLVNGGEVHALSPLDRGVHFGDGLFETIAFLGGRLRFLDLHLERLTAGCERLAINPEGLGLLRGEAELAASGAREGVVKVIVTRGEAVARGYAPAGLEKATRIVLRTPCVLAETAPAARAAVAELRLGESVALAGLKHLNRLEQVFAQRERIARGLDELILFSSSGRLVSGALSNVFLVAGGRLRTPRLDLCGVSGIMRSVVLREARQGGMTVEECELARADLDAAEEIFVTNARIGVWPVAELDARELGIGPVTQRVQALLEPLLRMSPGNATRA
jgi:4-amino-4-deoxychorismate lyase